MNKLLSDTISRLERLERLSSLLQAEITTVLSAINSMVSNSAISENTVRGVPFSPMSSKGLDIETILDQETEIKKVSEIKDYADSKNLLCGKDGLLVKYFSPTIVNGGKGFIKPNDFFQQYEEDIFLSSTMRLFTTAWSAGFYLNKKTSNIQLLLKLKDVVICIDGLPSLDVQLYVIFRTDNSIVPYSDEHIPYEKMQHLITDLELYLKNITDNYF